MKSISRVFASVLLLTVPLGVTAMPVLLVDITGQLLGANGVSVDATDDGIDNALLYDVTFRDDSCSNIFGNSCDSDTNFDFTTDFGAVAASNALSEQVFVDDGAVLFDTLQGNTFGCAPRTPAECIIWTPYADFGSDYVLIAGFLNGPTEELDQLLTTAGDSTDTWSTGDDFDYGEATDQVYAVWKRSVIPVHEPTTLALLALGLISIGWTRQKSFNNDRAIWVPKSLVSRRRPTNPGAIYANGESNRKNR